MYIGTVIVLVILALLGEGKRFAKLFVLLPFSRNSDFPGDHCWGHLR